MCIDILPKLAFEKARGTHFRLRRGTALAYQRRWSGIITIGVMNAVAAAALRSEGADLAATLVEPEPRPAVT